MVVSICIDVWWFVWCLCLGGLCFVLFCVEVVGVLFWFCILENVWVIFGWDL